MAIRVLGPLDTGNEHALSPRERVVLAALIVRAGRAVAPGELAEAYWGASPPRTWPQQVKSSVARIRSGLGTTAVLTRGSEYTLGIDPATIDAFEFERLVSGARRHALHGEHDRAVDAYGRALALWRGEAYIELAEWEPASVEAKRLAEIRDSAEEELLESRLAEGEHRSVIPDAERLVRESPLRENRWSILAIANYRAGRQAEALATIRAARARLADELGIDIGDGLQALERSMLQQDPSLAPVRVLHRVSEECPYRGLEAYAPSDADEFFGRDADIAAIRERLSAGGLTVVVGASGSGKSSLVMAGVLPRIAEGRRVAVVTAGRDAAVDLRARVSQRGAADVVIVDQAETVFQLTERERGELCALVAEVLRAGATVVMTLRSDFLDRATGLPHIGDILGRGVYAIGPLSEEGLREAIERPAAHAGLRLEAGLVEVIVRDAGDRRSTLPHVSHALVETWVRREGATLTVAGYEASGGIAGAIAQSAETLYRSLDQAEADACRAIMLRLVQRGPDGASVRRIAHVEPLVSDPSRRRVVDRLVAARLLTVDGDSAMVAHEAVASAWPRLDGWLEEDAEGARVMSAVSTAAEVWDADGRRDEDLLRGARLQAAVEWQAASDPDLTDVERAFVDASSAREQSELQTLAANAAREARSNRRLRWALSGAGVLLVAALVSGGFAVVRGQDAAVAAEDQLIEAVTARSVSLRSSNRDIAALMAVEAYRRWPDDARTRAALMSSLTAADGIVGPTYLEDIDWRAGMYPIPGTDQLAVARGTTVRIYDGATGKVLRELTHDLIPSDQVIRPWVRVSADGSTIAVLQHLIHEPPEYRDDEELVYFFDVASGEPIGDVIRVPAGAETFVLSPDGRYATWATLGILAVVDRDTGTAQVNGGFQVDPAPMETIASSAFARDGRVLLGTYGGDLHLVDRATLAVQETRTLEPGYVERGIILTADGTMMTFGRNGLIVFDAEGDQLWRRAVERDEECTRMTASSLSGVVACGDELGTVQLWDLRTGEQVIPPASYQLGGAGDLALVDEGRELLMLSALAPVVGHMRVDGGGPARRVVATGYTVDGGLDADGSRILVEAASNWDAGPDDPLAFAVWDVEEDAAIFRVPDDVVGEYDGTLAGLRWLTDDLLLSWDRTFDDDGAEHVVPRVIDITTGRLVDHGLPENLWEVFPSQTEGRILAITQEPAEVMAIDLASLTPTGPRIPVPAPWSVVSDNGDGTRIVVTHEADAANQAITTVFDAATGEELRQGLATNITSRTLPDGDIIAANGTGVARFDGEDLSRETTVPVSLGFIVEMHLSADGRVMLLKGAGSRAAALYDVDANLALGDALPERGPGFGTLARDGSAFALSGQEGVVLWTLDMAEQVSAACRLAGRDLTADEWATYLGQLGAREPICADALGR